jgi:hypothetical protein
LDNDNERSQLPTTSMSDSGPRSLVDISDESCEGSRSLVSSITRTLKLLALMRTENQHNADLHSEAIVQSRYRQAGLEIGHAHYEKVREV